MNGPVFGRQVSQTVEGSDSLAGKVVRCAGCGELLRIRESGGGTSGSKPEPKPPQEHFVIRNEGEDLAPSLWRNPAVYIAFAAIAALVVALVIMVTPPNPASPQQAAPSQKGSLMDKVAEESGKAASKDGAATPAKTGPIVDKVSAGTPAPKSQAAPIIGKPVTVAGQKPKEATANPLEEILRDPPAELKEAKPSPYQEIYDLAEAAKTGKPLKQAPLKAMTPEALYAMASPCVVKLTALNYKSEEIGQGTGFFVRQDGWIVTNHHVIHDAKYVSLTTAKGKSARADWILAWDEKADLAILVVNDGTTTAPPPTNLLSNMLEVGRRMETLGPKLLGETSMLPCLELVPAGYTPAIGSKVWAIGNPQGLANSLSEGIVSGLRSDGGVTQVQHTAAISPGSSGGPLLDCYGRVWGVTTSIQTDVERLSQNLNFAVSTEAIRSLLTIADSAAPRPVGVVRRRINCEETLAEKMADAEKNPGDARRWYSLGDYLNMLKRWTEARDAYRKSLQLKPNNPDALFGLAVAQWGLGDYAGVNESLKRAETLEPDIVKYKALLGGFYESTGRSEPAIKVLQEAIRLAPRSTEVRTRLIFILFNVGKYTDALLQCDELERLDPDQGRNVRKIILETLKSNEK